MTSSDETTDTSSSPPEDSRPAAELKQPAPSSPMPTTVYLDTDEDVPLIVAKGLGGEVQLYRDRIRILREGLLNYVIQLLGGHLPVVDTVIPIEKVASIDIICPIVINDYMTIAYPGAPPQTGHALVDATAENAIFLNFFDNRKLHDIVEVIQRRSSALPHVRFVPSGERRMRGRSGPGRGPRI